MAKPAEHKGKWRIRWIDEKGRRQSAVFDDYKRAQTELSRRQVEVEEIKRGIRNAAPPTGRSTTSSTTDRKACTAQAQQEGR